MNKAEYLVHSMCMNRVSACREFCSVHSWRMAQDVAKRFICIYRSGLGRSTGQGRLLSVCVSFVGHTDAKLQLNVCL